VSNAILRTLRESHISLSPCNHHYFCLESFDSYNIIIATPNNIRDITRLLSCARVSTTIGRRDPGVLNGVWAFETEAVAMAFAQELKRTVVMGAMLVVAVGAIGVRATADPPTPSGPPSQTGAAPELLLSSLVAPVVISVVAFFASFTL